MFVLPLDKRMIQLNGSAITIRPDLKRTLTSLNGSDFVRASFGFISFILDVTQPSDQGAAAWKRTFFAASPPPFSAPMPPGQAV
jgi:hypothetical protein